MIFPLWQQIEQDIMILHLGKSDPQQNMIKFRLKEKTNVLIVQNSVFSSWKFSMISVVSHKVDNIENTNQIKGRKRKLFLPSLYGSASNLSFDIVKNSRCLEHFIT